ncbi:serine hydrolase [Maricurvus nonylphenolicus]|uniref:serine hydrolase domain-containing protein n=1 Tax=Maricurvus nonylphenolicus TaxID=1008307 RepID=UPI0036F2FAAF
MKRKALLILSGAVLSIVVLGVINKTNIERLWFVKNLFSGAEQYQNFGRLHEMFPVTTMTAAEEVFNFPSGEQLELPKRFHYENSAIDVEAFLDATDTSGLLVLQNGKVRFERYMLTGGRDVNWLSMSVAKSVIASGIGIAIDEGLIDIQKSMTDYVPALKGSAYDQVRVKDVLQMSSGAAWNEDYSNPDSEVLKMGCVMAAGDSLNDFVANMTREFEPGTVNRYNSGDTQALGLLLTKATGRSITDYLTEKLWHPLGMESDAYWLIDDYQMEMAFGGLNATARDYAKIGELYRLKGNWQGKQILSAQWVQDATTPDAPHLMPGVNKDFPLGYAYQWWIPESSEGEFSAIGVYNQFIYVNPARDLVIVKLSANSEYGTTMTEEANKELRTLELFRAIAEKATGEII